MLCRERPYKALTPNITFWMDFELLRDLVLAIRVARDERYYLFHGLDVVDGDLGMKKTRETSALSLLTAWCMEAVVWPPFTICRSPIARIALPTPPRSTISSLRAVAEMPLL